MADFTSSQTSGTGGTELDLDTMLGVEPDESILVYDLVGDAGRNRVRLDYWKIHGEGISDIHGGFNFNTAPYPAGDRIETIIDLQARDPGVNIIAISGGGRIHPEDYLSWVKRFGVRYTFTKPVDREKLLAAIADLMPAGVG